MLSWELPTLLFLGILWTSSAQTFYVAAPDTIRLDSDETIAIALDGPSSYIVNVNVQDYPGRIKNLSLVTLDVKPSLPEVFKIRLSPSDFPPNFLNGPGDPKKVVINVASQSFQKSIVVPINLQAGYVFLHTDKPIYTPKQMVNFRIVYLDESQLPTDKNFTLQIKNPDGIVVKEITKRANPQKPFVTLNYKFPTYPVFGEWSASVNFGYQFQQNSTVHFELKEYVLPTFTVELETQDVILPQHDIIRAKVKAKYVYGKKVNGMVTFRLFIKADLPKALLFAVVGPKSLNDGSYELRLNTEELKNHKDVGWFPEIEGSHLVIEATVMDAASGKKETVKDSKGRFSVSPFLISFKRSLQDFRPGLVSVFEADITYIDGKPAPGILTKLTAKADGQPLRVSKDTAVSDEEGKVSFQIHPEMHHNVLSLTLETNDPQYEGSQQVKTFEQRKFQSANNVYIALDRSSNQKLTPGVQFIRTVHFEPESISDSYFLIVSKGKILSLNKLPHGNFKTQTVEFEVTYDMVPSFRLVVFAHYRNELIADSLNIDVEDVCHPNAEVRITPEFKTSKPGHPGKIIIEGSKYTMVGLLGVDEAVYALSKKDVLDRAKLFRKFASHDTGCGPGGGLTVQRVLRNAGILIATNNYSPPQDADNTCSELKRRKRELPHKMMDLYKGTDKECCAWGYDHDRFGRNCETRANALKGYFRGKYRSCTRAFLTCCLDAAEKGIDGIKLMRSSVPMARMGVVKAAEMQFVTLEEEAFLEKGSNVRKNFRETWIFQEITIGPDGKEEYPASLPHSITTWVIQAISVSPQHGICVAKEQKVVSFKDIFLQLNLPYSVVRNEQVEIQATIFNYGAERLAAIVYMYGVKDLCTGTQEGEKSERKRLIVDPESAQTTTFPVIPLKEGTYTIKVVALTPVGTDIIERELYVVPEGYTEETNIQVKLDPSNHQRRKRRHITNPDYSDSIDPTTNLQVTAIKLNLPEKFVPGTESCTISVIGDEYGTAVSTAINSPEKLLRRPHGCGEQNMVFLAPTLYTMKYLKSTGRITAEIEEKGYDFIRIGYGNELAFRKADGSYAAYQHKATSTWLTAFVMKVFCQASELVHIEEKVICSGMEWLVRNQQPDGSYIESHPVYHVEMMGGVQGKTAMTAFVLITLEECECDRVENLHLAKKRAVSFLEQHLGEVNKPLPVAIVAYALSLSDSDLKEAANDKLLSMAKYDEDMNTLRWETENAARNVETAGYALLNQLLFNDIARSSSIVNFLNAEQLHSGSYHSTQDTVVALQALSQYAIRAQMPTINLITNISSNNDRNFHHVLTFNEDNALVLQDIKVNNVGGMLFVKTTGRGVGSLAVKLRYNVFQPPDMVCKFHVTVNVSEVKDGQKDEGIDSDWNDEDRDFTLDPRGKDVFDPLPEDILRGAKRVLDEDPDNPVLIVDPRNRQLSSHVAGETLLNNENRAPRVRRQDIDRNSKLKLKILICARYLGSNSTEMSIVDVGIFSGFVPDEEDLKALEDDPNHLIQMYEKSNKGVVFYLQSVPHNENYCFHFYVTREYNVGNIHPSVVKVYDYYNPDATCTVFYNPGTNSPLLRTICQGGICQCAEGGCPPKSPFSEVSQLEPRRKRFEIKKNACDNYDYVWKGRLNGEIKKENGFYNIPFEIEEVIKEGIEKADFIEGETRNLLARDNCESAWMHDGQTYLVLGKDGRKYQNEKGEIWHRYLLDKKSIVYLWTHIKEAKEKPLQKALNIVMKTLKDEGCDA